MFGKKSAFFQKTVFPPFGCLSRKEPADLVVGEGKIVNVYTGEILNEYSIGIKGKWIVCVDKNLSSIIGPATEYLDVEGKYIIPGLIDAHAHIIAYCHPHDFLKEAKKDHYCNNRTS